MTVAQRIRRWLRKPGLDSVGTSSALLEYFGSDIAFVLEDWADAQRIMIDAYRKIQAEGESTDLTYSPELTSRIARLQRLGFEVEK